MAILKNSSNLAKRLVTAAVMMGLIYVNFFSLAPSHSHYFFLLLAFGAIGEWCWLLNTSRKAVAICLYWLAGGTFYIACGLYGLWATYATSPTTLLYIVMGIWISDTAAYFIGRKFQGPKLAPSISPNKTWSGAVGGLTAVTVYAFILTSNNYIGHEMAVTLIALCPVAQLGDLLESAVKRHFNLKDTSQILPGHGGLLDRLDSSLIVGNVLLLMKLV